MRKKSLLPLLLTGVISLGCTEAPKEDNTSPRFSKVFQDKIHFTDDCPSTLRAYATIFGSTVELKKQYENGNHSAFYFPRALNNYNTSFTTWAEDPEGNRSEPRTLHIRKKGLYETEKTQ